MTGDEFSSRFRLVEKLTEAGVTTYRGTDSRRGGVLVHLMPGPETPTPETLADRGLTLAAIDELAWHECLDVEGMRVVVTTELDDFTTYEAWIEEVEERARAFGGGGSIEAPTSPPEPEVPEEVEAPLVDPSEPEEGIEAAGEATPIADDVDTPSEDDAGEGGEEPADPATDAPGEFTRIFGASELESDVEGIGSSTSAPASPGAPPSREEPEPRPADATPPDDGAAPTAEPPSPETVPSDPPETAPPETPPDGPGEYTRIMMQLEGIEAPSPPPSPPSPDAPEKEPQERERSTPVEDDSEVDGADDVVGPAPDPAVEAGPSDAAAPTSTGGEAPDAGRVRDEEDEEADDGPGPYTRLMRRGGRADAGEEAPSSGSGSFPYRRESPGSPARDSGGGEAFTPGGGASDAYLDRLRGGGDAPAPPPDVSSSAAPEGDARTGGAPSPPPAPPPASTGPSEYTRIIRGGREERPAPAPEPPAVARPPAPEPRPEPSGPSKKPIVIALVVVVLVLVAIVVYFALWGPQAG